MADKSPLAAIVIAHMKKGSDKGEPDVDPALVTAIEDFAQHLKDEDFDKAARCFQDAFDACDTAKNRGDDDEDEEPEDDDKGY